MDWKKAKKDLLKKPGWRWEYIKQIIKDAFTL